MIVAEFERGEWRRTEPGILFEVHGASRWLEEGVLPNVTGRLGRLSLGPEARELTKPWFPPLPGSWELFWGLVAVEEFVIEEPLRGMVDQSFYLAHDVYRALWEARFLAKEYGQVGQKGPAPAIAASIVRWFTGSDLDEEDREVLTSIGIKRNVSSEQERLDVLCFLLTLGVQNGLLSRLVLFFDSLEEALTPARRGLLRQLHAFIAGITRWNRIGPPAIGVMIGLSPTRTNMSALRRFHTKFHDEIEAGLLWTKGSP